MTLIACSSCRRHVSDHDRACPFCGALRERVESKPRSIVAGRLSRAAILAGLAACDAGQKPAPPQPEGSGSAQKKTGPAVLHGVITDMESRTRAARLKVRLYRSGGDIRGDYEATTDDKGAYKFPTLPPGSYMMVFISPMGEQLVEQRSVELHDGETLAVDLAVDTTPVPIAPPYGAPPMHRRLV